MVKIENNNWLILLCFTNNFPPLVSIIYGNNAWFPQFSATCIVDWDQKFAQAIEVKNAESIEFQSCTKTFEF